MSAKPIVRSNQPLQVCAVVVTFFPDPEFKQRIERVLPQIGMLVVVDNTPEKVQSLDLCDLAKRDRRIHLILNKTNLGIATALNQGLERAYEAGFKWILTLDQDTLCASDMVVTLLDAYGAYSSGIAVVGSNYFDPRRGGLEVPADATHLSRDRVTVITSGSLIDTKVAHKIGGFRHDYFIDQVDHEFCLRMRAHGYRVAICSKPIMTHSVGKTGGASLPLFGMFPNHSALRKYYITRNSIVTVLEYWRLEPMWCLRRSIRLFLGLLLMAILEKHRTAKIRAFVAGFRDGISHRMGPCCIKWLQNY